MGYKAARCIAKYDGSCDLVWRSCASALTTSIDGAMRAMELGCPHDPRAAALLHKRHFAPAKVA